MYKAIYVTWFSIKCEKMNPVNKCFIVLLGGGGECVGRDGPPEEDWEPFKLSWLLDTECQGK